MESRDHSGSHYLQVRASKAKAPEIVLGALYMIFGGRYEIRTHDPRLRRPVLYPAELTARIVKDIHL